MTTAEKVIAFIERYCFVPEGALVGQPIKLEDFKKFISMMYTTILMVQATVFYLLVVRMVKQH